MPCAHTPASVYGNEALAQAPADVDPTRTKTLRRRYAQRLRGGFADINTEIRDGVRERDIFGLENEALADPLDGRKFRFKTDDDKVEQFRSWLQRAQREEVLEIISRDNNEFIRSGYGRGIKHADARLREQGVEVPQEDLEAVFRKPVHRDKLQLLYTRNFQALEGITDAVDKEVSRVLTQGLAEGVNPREAARRITDRVDKIGKTRATTLARTEIINAHSEATLDRFERMDVDEVGVKAEWQTAGDSRVCPICASLEGSTFTIDEARGKLPAHPRCRCAFLPVVN